MFARILLISAVVLSAAVMPSSAQEAQAQQPQQATGPTADATVRRAFDMMAGTAWEKARFFQFIFQVQRDGKTVAEFPQKWDRYTNDYRVTGRNPKGEEFVVVMNTNTKKGKAWLNGQPVAEPAELLEMGYRRFINDTYWLLMPLKAFDPGVTREAVGERTDSCGQKWDVVKLSFGDGVGLTPGDQYWMWVNRATGLVDEWDMKLQSAKADDRPVPVMFHDYGRFGGLLISTRREVRGKGQEIFLKDLQVLPEVPKGAFDK